MIEPALIVVRLAQYLGAMILMGSSLFFLCSKAETGFAGLGARRRRLLLAAAAVLAISAPAAILLQSVLFTGSFAEGLKPENLGAVATGMALGKAALVRAVAAVAALYVLLVARSGSSSWSVTAALGLVATVSLAWMGHGAAGEGTTGSIQLVADVLHLLAAALWMGALFGFSQLLLLRPSTPDGFQALHAALKGFSGVGSVLVTVLLLTGLVNGWVLIGPDRLEALWGSAYGRLLSLKLLLFTGMLALAWTNRVRLTPGLGRSMPDGEGVGSALTALRRSVTLETALGCAVVALVAWLGTLAPPAVL